MQPIDQLNLLSASKDGATDTAHVSQKKLVVVCEVHRCCHEEHHTKVYKKSIMSIKSSL